METPQKLEQINLFDDFTVIRNYEQGKDELNLAEFPICSLYKVRDPSIKTLQFEDQIEDKSKGGALVNRKLTITASDKYGLPSAFDDEVILALIQLSKLQGFKDRKVFFTKRQILEILGWDSGGKNSKRVEESLNRWLGVTLIYNQAWRDKNNDEWETKGFHILETVFFKEHQHNPFGKHSYIVWNDIVFKSMKDGNLKSLNFSIFKKLSCPTAKRIFRFLDKRFYHRRSLKFDLTDFAYQKIGIDRRYGAADIKRKLKAGITELESVGFLQPMTNEGRYHKSQGKSWNIYFIKGKSHQNKVSVELPTECELEIQLIASGITKSKARKLSESYPKKHIQEKIEFLEFLIVNKKSPKNSGGWLFSAIEENYESPANFQSKEELEQEALKNQEKQEILEGLKLQKQEKLKSEENNIEAENQLAEDQQRKVDDYLALMSSYERAKTKQEALSEAKDHPMIEAKGAAGNLARQGAIVDYVLKILED